MNTLIIAAFAVLATTASASIHDLGYAHGGGHGVHPYALSPIGPSGIVTGHGAKGPSGIVTGYGAAGPSGIVTGAGPIGPTGPAGHGHYGGHGVVVAAPVLAVGHAGYGAGYGHGGYGLGGHGLGYGGFGHGYGAVGVIGHGAYGLGGHGLGLGHGVHGW